MADPRRARSGSRERITRLAAATAAGALAATGCALGPARPPVEAVERAASWLRAAPPPAGAVVVRLAFDAGADLDLYVTGPRRETVYFANTPTRIGGRLEADQRCDAPAPRIETVVFPDPWPGPYRVGVDFPESCDGRDAAVGFAIDLHSSAGHSTHTARLRPGEFEPIVLEWVEPAAPE